jgi:hypothetical protein
MEVRAQFARDQLAHSQAGRQQETPTKVPAVEQKQGPVETITGAAGFLLILLFAMGLALASYFVAL